MSMRVAVLAGAVCVAAFAPWCWGQDGDPASAPAQQEESAVYARGSVTVEGVAYPYLLLTPPEGAEAPADGWPLVVFLHGAGERGTDNGAQARHFPERMAGADYRERFGCYLLAVQCPGDDRWASFDWRSEERQSQAEEPTAPMSAVMEEIRALVAEHDIDLRRIYLTGLSMGGFGSWDLAARKPEWFAAVVPVCGGGDPGAAGAYKNLPIWAWHDAGDPVVPVLLTRKMVDAARGAGAEVRYDEVTGYGHASWVAAYEKDKAPAWMFEQRREEPAAELVALRPAR
jgi:predicted peptidase